jgi:carboxymethylenebutenolidase
MGELVDFASNGDRASAYLAVPASGSGPGVIVIQEYWGLVPHIEEVCERFAGKGFVALAPDLYHGQTTTEPDEAGKIMMTLNMDAAARDMSGAVDHLLGLDAVTSSGVGVIGFCMGGGLALLLAQQRPDVVQACAPYYGLIPWAAAEPDWSRLAAPVHGHYAADDGFFNAEAARAFEKELQDLGKDVTFEIHPGCDHAFFNDTRPEVHDPTESERAWDETIAFFRSTIR